WPGAPGLDRRTAAAAREFAAAERNAQPVALVIPSNGGQDIIPSDAGKALNRLQAIKPLPYVPDRLATAGAIEKFAAVHQKPIVVWIADGLDRGHAREFAQTFASLGSGATVITDEANIRALAGAENQPGRLDVRVVRPSPAGPGVGIVRAFDRKGLQLGEAAFDFGGAIE